MTPGRIKREKYKKGNKVLEAAALHYKNGENRAPVVAAVGRGHVAEQILARALEHHVPVVSDALLAQTLTRMQVGDEIPREFYAIVAQILVMVSKMDREYKK